MLDNLALAALNHLLQNADWARKRLTPFAGRTARLSAPPLHLDLTVDDDGMFAETGSAAFDVEIELPANAPLLMLGGTEKLLRAAHITGSADFANELGFVLRNLRWDFEEDLSGKVGDIAAHRIAAQIKAFGAWQQDASRRLGENFVEYLTEERPMLVRDSEMKEFSAGVKRLDDDLTALERRIVRLA